MIYLDNNATTRIDPQVVAAMVQAWDSGPLNPSSQHASGRRAQHLLDQSLAKVAQLLGTDIVRTGGSQLLLTSGGTEANHWAFHGLVPPECPRWISQIEHPSLLEPARLHATLNFPLEWIPVDSNGQVSVPELSERLQRSLGSPLDTNARRVSPRGFLSVMAANNETGVLQPLGELAQLCHQWGLLFHTDATQWVGKMPLHFDLLGLHALTFTPHKFHGPVGVGGLLLATGNDRLRVKIEPLWRGGQQQLALRPGTEPVALAVGMARALELATDSLSWAQSHCLELRNHFEQTLRAAVPNCVIHGAAVDRLPSTTSVSFPGIDRQTLLMRLDMVGVACSTGSACTSGSSEPSHVLAAMGLSEDHLDSAVRFGMSRLSTSEEICLALDRILNSINKLRTG